MNFSPRQMCSGLGPAQRQMIEIMRAVQAGGRLIAFDEPTSSLTDEETRRLCSPSSTGCKRRWRCRHLHLAPPGGDHRAGRQGRHPARRIAGRQSSRQRRLARRRITRLMVGRPLSDMFPDRDPVRRRRRPAGSRDMTTEHVTGHLASTFSRGRGFGDRRSDRGRTVGTGERTCSGSTTGPVGSGDAGRAGRCRSGDTAAAIAAGIGFAPEDRKEEALLLMQTILENAVLCRARARCRVGGFFSRSKRTGADVGHIAPDAAQGILAGCARSPRSRGAISRRSC